MKEGGDWIGKCGLICVQVCGCVEEGQRGSTSGICLSQSCHIDRHVNRD